MTTIQRPTIRMPALAACVLDSTSPRAGLSDLPRDLLDLIFRPLCPILPRGPDLPLPWFHTIRVLLQELKPFADLRLVCSSFNDAIVPIFFQEAIILIQPFTRPEGLTEFFRSGAAYMKSVVILGYTRHKDLPRTSQWPSAAPVKEALGQGLGLLTRLQNLECHGEHGTFADPFWFQSFTPNLTLFLSITPREVGLHQSISSLGASLTHLAIIDWDGRDDIDDFPTAPCLPNLTHLTVQHGDPPPHGLQKLFASIKDTRGRTPLRFLSILDLHMNNDNVDVITDLLTTDDLGAQLCSLRLLLSFNYLTNTTKAAEFPKIVLQACPNLKEFSYVTQVIDRGIFSYLPPTLEKLEVMALPTLLRIRASTPVTPVTPEAIAAFLRGRNRPALRVVSVRSLSSTFAMAVDPLLTAVCEEVGAKMSNSGNGSAMIVL